jgi:hypothetical protein
MSPVTHGLINPLTAQQVNQTQQLPRVNDIAAQGAGENIFPLAYNLV